MTEVPAPRRAREDAARYRAFFEAMQRYADKPGLRDELADACGHVTMPNDNGEVFYWARFDPVGQVAADAVRVVLARQGLPHQLVEWAVTLGVCGAAHPALAHEYLNSHVAPAVAPEREPLTGQPQIVLRVPADWSKRRIDAWLRDALERLAHYKVRGDPVFPRSRGGRPRKLTRDEALALAHEFDEQLSAEWAKQTPPRVDGMGQDDWIEAFQSWLDRNDKPLGAERMTRTHLRPALDAGDLKLRTLDVAKRANSG